MGMQSITIRWLIRRDMDEVIAIEKIGSANPWDSDDLLAQLRNSNAIGVVGEIGNTIVGFMVYLLFQNELQLLKLTVDPLERYKGHGTQMIQRLKDKLEQQRRVAISTDVAECNTIGQLFMSRHGFKARVIRGNTLPGTDVPAYRMRYQLPVKSESERGSGVRCSMSRGSDE